MTNSTHALTALADQQNQMAGEAGSDLRSVVHDLSANMQEKSTMRDVEAQFEAIENKEDDQSLLQLGLKTDSASYWHQDSANGYHEEDYNAYDSFLFM
ncbi:MAG: hypothetical protein AAFZ09_14765 [Pseudomonadota bacterium]